MKENRRNGANRWIAMIALAMLCGVLGAAVSRSASDRSENPPPAAPAMAEVEQEAPLMENAETSKTMTPQRVFNSNVKCVVGINNETTTNVFGQAASTASTGTGFILSEDGYIATNHHVVDQAESLSVVLHDGRTFQATLIGSDPENDVALLKIAAEGLQSASIGDSSALQVGEVVCTIGNPLGELTNTLTVGYVSALDREINTDGAPINMLQTDCAINAGNSGGPLFDMDGNVIAITTAKYYGDTIEGLGFAIPINDAVEIIKDLKAYGYVVGRARLGVHVIDVDPNLVKFYGLPAGVYVHTVEDGSCAQLAGVQEADLITAIGSYKVETMTDLLSALKHFKAGDAATLQIWRNNGERTLSVTLDEKIPEKDTEEASGAS